MIQLTYEAATEPLKQRISQLEAELATYVANRQLIAAAEGMSMDIEELKRKLDPLEIEGGAPLEQIAAPRNAETKPVAWLCEDNNAEKNMYAGNFLMWKPLDGHKNTPLYAHQPAQQIAPTINWGHISGLANTYAEEYEFYDGDGGIHIPTENERLLIVDAINGMFADPELMAAFAAAPQPAQQMPEGWQLVPIEPTKEMYTAATEIEGSDETADYDDIYRAMLAASPAHQPAQQIPEGNVDAKRWRMLEQMSADPEIKALLELIDVAFAASLRSGE